MQKQSRPADDGSLRDRVEACADEVEDLRNALYDAIGRRNVAIVAALDAGAGARRQIAAWSQLSLPMLSRVVASAG